MNHSLFLVQLVFTVASAPHTTWHALMRWCDEVSGVMSYNLGVAMNVHADGMQQHLVSLVSHGRSRSTRLKGAARARPSIPTFVIVNPHFHGTINSNQGIHQPNEAQ